MRVITRMNVGGPALQAAALMRGLDAGLFDHRLYTGVVEPDEADYLDLRAADISPHRIPAFGRSVRPADDARHRRTRQRDAPVPAAPRAHPHRQGRRAGPDRRGADARARARAHPSWAPAVPLLLPRQDTAGGGDRADLGPDDRPAHRRRRTRPRRTHRRGNRPPGAICRGATGCLTRPAPRPCRGPARARHTRRWSDRRIRTAIAEFPPGCEHPVSRHRASD
jgi:hypothetical protein